jgi:hypothetical protein
MARATSGTPIIHFSGAGFWIAMLMLLFLPESVCRMIASIIEDTNDPDRREDSSNTRWN